MRTTTYPLLNEATRLQAQLIFAHDVNSTKRPQVEKIQNEIGRIEAMYLELFPEGFPNDYNPIECA